MNSVEATYSAFGGGTAKTVLGSFNAPRFDCMLSDVASPRLGDLYTISGVRYRVKSPPRVDPVSGVIENDLELVK